jgi:hypothetical protein
VINNHCLGCNTTSIDLKKSLRFATKSLPIKTNTLAAVSTEVNSQGNEGEREYHKDQRNRRDRCDGNRSRHVFGSVKSQKAKAEEASSLAFDHELKSQLSPVYYSATHAVNSSSKLTASQ